jgi:hypothetical protein
MRHHFMLQSVRRNSTSARRCCRPSTEADLLPSLVAERPSLALLESHYENNYGGALWRLNDHRTAESLDFAKTPGYVINGLKREEPHSTTAAARALFRQHGR